VPASSGPKKRKEKKSRKCTLRATPPISFLLGTVPGRAHDKGEGKKLREVGLREGKEKGAGASGQLDPVPGFSFHLPRLSGTGL